MNPLLVVDQQGAHEGHDSLEQVARLPLLFINHAVCATLAVQRTGAIDQDQDSRHQCQPPPELARHQPAAAADQHLRRVEWEEVGTGVG